MTTSGTWPCERCGTLVYPYEVRGFGCVDCGQLLGIWDLELPDNDYVTPNSRVHWSKRSACGAAWREATFWLAKQTRIPSLDRIVVTLTMVPKDRRRRDRDNLVSGVLKHAIDGLVDAAVVPDDTPAYVDARMPVIADPEPSSSTHRWILTVEAA